MTQKTETIITTVFGVVTTVISALVAAFKPEASVVTIGVLGCLNEAVNVLLEHFVKKE